MFLIMAWVSGDDVCSLSSAWRSSGVLPYSSRNHTSCFWFVYESRYAYMCFTFVSTLIEPYLFYSVSVIKRRGKTLFIEKKIENHVFQNLLLLSSPSHGSYVHRVLLKKETALLKAQLWLPITLKETVTRFGSYFIHTEPTKTR